MPPHLCVCVCVSQVLVDAPCSNDRSWLFTSSDQQGELWLKERQKLPKLQAQLLWYDCVWLCVCVVV